MEDRSKCSRRNARNPRRKTRKRRTKSHHLLQKEITTINQRRVYRNAGWHVALFTGGSGFADLAYGPLLSFAAEVGLVSPVSVDIILVVYTSPDSVPDIMRSALVALCLGVMPAVGFVALTT